MSELSPKKIYDDAYWSQYHQVSLPVSPFSNVYNSFLKVLLSCIIFSLPIEWKLKIFQEEMIGLDSSKSPPPSASSSSSSTSPSPTPSPPSTSSLVPTPLVAPPSPLSDQRSSSSSSSSLSPLSPELSSLSLASSSSAPSFSYSSSSMAPSAPFHQVSMRIFHVIQAALCYDIVNEFDAQSLSSSLSLLHLTFVSSKGKSNPALEQRVAAILRNVLHIVYWRSFSYVSQKNCDNYKFLERKCEEIEVAVLVAPFFGLSQIFLDLLFINRNVMEKLS